MPAPQVPIDRRDYPNELLHPNEAAEILGVSVGTMANWRVTGFGPEFVRLSRKAIRYSRRALEAFAQTSLREQEPADELTDEELVKLIARLANRLARRQRAAAEQPGERLVRNRDRQRGKDRAGSAA